MRTGTVVSGAAHAAVILLAIFGDQLFPRRRLPPLDVSEVTLVSGPEFDAAISTAPAAPTEGFPPPPPPRVADRAQAPEPPPPAETAAPPPPPAETPPPPPPVVAPIPDVADAPVETVGSVPALAPPPPPTPPARRPPAEVEVARAEPPATEPPPAAVPAPPAIEPPPPPVAEDGEEPPIASPPPAPAATPPVETAPPAAPRSRPQELRAVAEATRAAERAARQQSAARPEPPRPEPARPEPPREDAPSRTSAPARDAVAEALAQLEAQERTEQAAARPAPTTPPRAPAGGSRLDRPISGSAIAALREGIRRRFNPVQGGASAQIAVQLEVSLTAEGKIQGRPAVVAPRGSLDQPHRALERAALRALFAAADDGVFRALPPDSYENWRTILVTFTPEEVSLL